MNLMFTFLKEYDIRLFDYLWPYIQGCVYKILSTANVDFLNRQNTMKIQGSIYTPDIKTNIRSKH